VSAARPELAAEVERRRRLRQRNIALGLALLALVALFYVITLYKGVPLIANRSL
jgi:hypothetical protein